MADLVYNAHRTEGGWGIAPPDPTLKVINGDEAVTLKWEVPEKTTVEGQTICRTAGVMIRRSEEKAPETELEGELVIDSAQLTGSHEDTGLTNGNTYHYRAFPYSDHKVYNRGNKSGGSATPSHTAKVNITYKAKEAQGCTIKAVQGGSSKTATVNQSGLAQFELETTGDWRIGGQIVHVDHLGEMIDLEEQLYGYDWTLGESDPEAAITYPAGVDNAAFAPVPARGADGEIDLGAWEVFHEFVGCRPVMLNFTGTVAYELNHADQTLKKEGGTSDLSDQAKDMNAMVEFPKRYFKRITEGDGDETPLTAKFRVSRLKLGDDWKSFPWMYGTKEADAKENDVIYLPMFEGSNISSKVRSLADKAPYQGAAGAVEWTAIQALGDGWIFDDFPDEQMIVDYMFLMGRSTDVQKHWGNGHNAGGSQASHLHNTGSLKTYGAYYGGTGNTNMKFMWLENYYADRWTRSMGVWYLTNILWLKNFPPYTTDPAQVTDANGWKSLGRGIGGTSGGYISEVTYDENGMIPKTASGSQTTYVPDGCWFASGQMFLLWGGACSSALLCGAAFYVNGAFSYANWSVGPSPAYKKPIAA